MSESTTWRLLGARDAFASPVVVSLTIVVAVVLVVAPVVMILLARRGRIDPKMRRELRERYLSWLIIVPAMLVPVLLGALWTILGVGALSLLCYREFARATGLFRERAISATVTLGILLVTFAVLDNWYELFAALGPLTIAAIAIVAIFEDRPKGYIQRVGLGSLAFMLFGAGLAHLGYFANDSNYRAIIFLIVLCVELNDIFAFCVGKTIGRHKLAPSTSPNKTIEGSIGALILTTILASIIGHFVFRATILDTLPRLIGLGLIIGALGQLGDLLMSSVKRDVGIKDMGVVLPGHGGFLDRFNSLLLVSPAVFHYVGYFLGIGADQPARIISGL